MEAVLVATMAEGWLSMLDLIAVGIVIAFFGRVGIFAAHGREDRMNALYVIGALVAAGLLAYLFAALLWPERFS
jgi:K+-transporting ATPase KdpF subunit